MLELLKMKKAVISKALLSCPMHLSKIDMAKWKYYAWSIFIFITIIYPLPYVPTSLSDKKHLAL